jgi:hypothetical protein
MKTCDSCKGAGEVPTDPYREPATTPKPQKVKSPKMKAAQIKNIAGAIAIILAFPGILGGLGLGCRAIIRSDDADREARAKQGVIFAQYAADGSVQRCWLAHSADTIRLTGPSASIGSSNIEIDNSQLAASIGITDISKCIVYR